MKLHLLLTIQRNGERNFGVSQSLSSLCFNSKIRTSDLDILNKILETRTQGSPHIWTLLKNACEETHDTAEALILAAGLSMPQNSLTLVIDENGVYYRVPISCINDPINYSVNYQDEKLKGKSKPAEKVFNVSYRRPY